MTYATVCSGIEAPSVAWHPLGFKPVFFSEIEKFPSRVLAHHYPDVPNLGDMNKINGKKYSKSIDIICGGTPCQSFSIAGLRKGMADPRGNLALVFLRLVDQIRPKWVVWENVPGVLSSWSDAEDSEEVEGIGPENGRDVEQTNDFDTFLAGLRELGYGCAWRILDAKYFGVPQRRRRVFVVGHLGDWQAASAVLFERESLRWDFAPRKRQGPGLAADAEGGTRAYRWQNNTDGLIEDDKSATLKANGSKTDERGVGAYIADFRNQTIGEISPTLMANGKGTSANNTPYVMATGQGNAEILTGQSPALTCNHEAPIVFDNLQITSPQNRSKCDPGDQTPTITKASQITVAFDSGTVNKPNNRSSYEPCGASPALLAGGSPCVAISTSGNGFWREGFGALRARGQDSHENLIVKNGYTVRRITPIEAERLQGFQDGYTDIPGAADGPRYKALGNSMAVPVMRWVGQRIKLIDEILKSL